MKKLNELKKSLTVGVSALLITGAMADHRACTGFNGRNSVCAEFLDLCQAGCNR